MRSLRAGLTFITCGLTKVIPCLTTIYRNIPVTILNLQLWSHSILSRFTLRTLRTGFTLRALRTSCTIYTNRLDLIAILIQKPLTVKSPVVQSIRILPYTDLRCVAVLSVSTICTILAMIDGYGSALVESNLITYFLTVLHHRYNSCDIILSLKGCNHCVKRLNIGIGLIAESIQTRIDIINLLMDLCKFISIDILATHKQHTSQQDNVNNLPHKFLC